MRGLRLSLLALIVVLALAGLAAAAASAAETEAGLLYLAGEDGKITFTGKGGAGSLTSAASVSNWTASALSGEGAQTEKHIITGNAQLTLTGYKLTKGMAKVACNTEGDAKETVLAGLNWTLFNLLDSATKKVLEPGIGFTHTSIELTIKCGAVVNVIVKGTFLGLITDVSLSADITTAEFHFVKAGEMCDSENVFCKKAQEKANELLQNVTGTFEKAEIETNLSATLDKMVLVDD